MAGFVSTLGLPKWVGVFPSKSRDKRVHSQKVSCNHLSVSFLWRYGVLLLGVPYPILRQTHAMSSRTGSLFILPKAPYRSLGVGRARTDPGTSPARWLSRTAA